MVCAGEQIITMCEPGITSSAFEETLFIFPTRFPLDSQADLAVYAIISSLKISGRLVMMLIFHLGLLCPIVAIEAHARLPPPANVT